jgi:predicted aconitase
VRALLVTLGGYIGEKSGNSWSVPALEGVQSNPSSDALKHFGAAMASFGSSAMFHILGVTLETIHQRDLELDPLPVQKISRADMLAVTSPQVKPDADPMCFTETIPAGHAQGRCRQCLDAV